MPDSVWNGCGVNRPKADLRLNGWLGEQRRGIVRFPLPGQQQLFDCLLKFLNVLDSFELTGLTFDFECLPQRDGERLHGVRLGTWKVSVSLINVVTNETVSPACALSLLIGVFNDSSSSLQIASDSKVSGWVDRCLMVMKWEYTQLRFVPKGKSWTGEIEELWLDDQQLISRNHPQRDVTLVGLMNELGLQGWELVTYAQPFTGYHGGCYTFKRSV